MKCLQMQVKDFRNIEYADLSFSDNVNILYGQNAQGKTNMLEAIFYTALGRAFRPAKDSELIRFGCESAVLSNTFEDSIRKQNISMNFFSDRRQRKVEQNKVKVTKMSDIVGAFRVVMFSPEHLSLIKDGPSVRRNFLDVALSQLYPMYLKSLQKFNHILKQRNTLIKNAKDSENRSFFNETADILSEQLADECAIITGYRNAYLKEITEECKEIFREMTGDSECPAIEYKPSAGDACGDLDSDELKEKYLAKLTSHYEREICAETSLWGIHRDDVEIYLNGKPARIFASQGQQRSLALAMKLAEGQISYKKRDKEHPVFLLDDVLSELDVSRRTYLMEKIKDKQVIMTTCDEVSSNGAEIIDVKNGVYVKR